MVHTNLLDSAPLYKLKLLFPLDVMSVIYTQASKSLPTSPGADMHMQQRYVLRLVTILPGSVDSAGSHGLKLVMEQQLEIHHLLHHLPHT